MTVRDAIILLNSVYIVTKGLGGSMFRTAELGQKIPKKEYNKLEIILRQELLELQHQLLQMAKTSVLVVFAGVDGGGKGATVNLLNTWLDARWLRNHAYRQPSDEEKERPEYWRYWRDIPPKPSPGSLRLLCGCCQMAF